MSILAVLFLTPFPVTAETVSTKAEQTTEQPTQTENSEKAAEVPSAPEEWKNPIEDNIYTKIVNNGDGTCTATLYDHPVRFVNEEGRLQNISLEISAENQTVFPKTISDGITLSGNGVNLKLTPAKSASSGKASLSASASSNDLQTLSSSVRKIDSQKVAYTYDSKTTLEYQLTYTGFKEDIVVSEYTGQTEYHFLLETGGLTLTKIDESYFLTDEKGKIKATIGDIIIFTADERNNALGSMTHTVVRENQQYIMTIHVDADYLKDEKTKYPIRIDPTMEITYENCGTGALQDVTINSTAGSSGSSGSIYVGRRETYGISRTLIKFPYIDFTGFWPEFLIEISVEIRDILCQSEELAIEAYIFDGGSWSESTASWTTVQPHNIASWQDTIYVSYANGVNLSPKHRYSIDITTAARFWSNGVYEQNGIVLKARSTLEYSDTYIFKTFASYNRATNKPSLVIKYINPNSVSPPEGQLESVTSTKISGWAYVSDTPYWSVRIKLVLTNTTFAGASPDPIIFSTDLYREDLEEAGYSRGPHGFSYSISWGDFAPGEYTVYAYAENYYGDWVLLNGAPKTYGNYLDQSYTEGTSYINNKEYGKYLKNNSGTPIGQSGLIGDLGTTIQWNVEKYSGGYVFASTSNTSQYLAVSTGTVSTVELYTSSSATIPARCIWDIEIIGGGCVVSNRYNAKYLTCDSTVVYLLLINLVQKAHQHTDHKHGDLCMPTVMGFNLLVNSDN